MKFLLEKLIIFLKMYYFYFYTILKVVLHLQLLPNIWYIPHVRQSTLVPQLTTNSLYLPFSRGFCEGEGKVVCP